MRTRSGLQRVGRRVRQEGGGVEGEGCVDRGVLHGTHDNISL